MRMPGDVVFSIGTLIMAWDFLVKLMKPRSEGTDRTGRPVLAPAE
jgi:nitric oxide reductase large subunit